MDVESRQWSGRAWAGWSRLIAMHISCTLPRGCVRPKGPSRRRQCVKHLLAITGPHHSLTHCVQHTHVHPYHCLRGGKAGNRFRASTEHVSIKCDETYKTTPVSSPRSSTTSLIINLLELQALPHTTSLRCQPSHATEDVEHIMPGSRTTPGPQRIFVQEKNRRPKRQRATHASSDAPTDGRTTVAPGVYLCLPMIALPPTAPPQTHSACAFSHHQSVPR